MTSYNRLLAAILAALVLAMLIPLSARSASGGPDLWEVDTAADFEAGTLTGVDTWSQPGELILDRRWGLNTQVNDLGVVDSRFQPDVTTLVTHTATTSGTLFVATWADERVVDHDPDIYVALRTTDGHIWSPDILISGGHVGGERKWDPAIAARAADESLWVVWQYEKGTNGGDLYYATSSDAGQTWASNLALTTASGVQHSPDIVSAEASGYLYAAWEDERADDGNIFIARYNPDLGGPWQAIRADDGPSVSEQASPSVAADGSGNVYLAWEDYRNDPDGYDSDIYFASWNAAGTWTAGSWSSSVQLSDSSADWGSDPALAVGPDDKLYAAWVERVGTGPASSTYDFQVVVATSEDQGGTWSRTVVESKFGDSGGSNAFIGTPDLGVDASGRVYVTWLYYPDQSDATSGEVKFAQSPDGGGFWTQAVNVSVPASEVSTDADPALAVSDTGVAVVVWEDFALGSSHQIFASSYPGVLYRPNGTWVGTLDPGGLASWDTITWTATVPPLAGLEMATRVLTAPGASWTTWEPHASSGAMLTYPDARFLQVRATLSSTLSGGGTPVLDSVSVSYTACSVVYLPLVLR